MAFDDICKFDWLVLRVIALLLTMLPILLFGLPMLLLFAIQCPSWLAQLFGPFEGTLLLMAAGCCCCRRISDWPFGKCDLLIAPLPVTITGNPRRLCTMHVRIGLLLCDVQCNARDGLVKHDRHKTLRRLAFMHRCAGSPVALKIHAYQT